MKLLHTADWHLGLSLGGISLLEEQRHWAEELTQMARAERVDAVLVTGDIFDRAVASADAIALYDEAVTRLARDCGTRVLLLAGNHDGAARLSQLSALLEAAGLSVAGSLKGAPRPVTVGDAEIYLIPYFHPEQVRLLYPDKEIRTAHEAMRALMDDIRARRDPGKKLIIGAHCFVTGASPAESDYGAQLGGAAQVGAEVFAGADYVALGHLHCAQNPAPHVYYSGSPYPYAFSEGACAAMLYDTADGTARALPFHPARTLRAISGAYGDVLSAAEADTRRDDYLKIELTDRPAGLEALETLRALYPNLVMLAGTAGAGGAADTLSVRELQSLSPGGLLARFCEEVGGFSPDDRQTAWFLSALASAREGGGLQ